MDQPRSATSQTYFGYRELFVKYEDELFSLTRSLRSQFHRMEGSGYGTAFQDAEGELLYLLVRETKPEVIFEISPFHGWSTNYLLAALTANGRGSLHSFELMTHVNGKPIDAVIRDNQSPDWDQDRLVVHVGDATEKVHEVPGPVDFVLLDSCHEGWFADWYIEELLPRVSGTVFLQDVAFEDALEASPEARRVWGWLDEHKIGVDLVGVLERDETIEKVRCSFPERRNRRSNAIVFKLPDHSYGPPPVLARSPDSRLTEAEEALARGEPRLAESLTNQVVYQVLNEARRALRHRDLIRAGDIFSTLGDAGEASRSYQRAIGLAMLGDARDREKAFAELLAIFVRRREYSRARLVASLVMRERGGFSILIRRAWMAISDRLRRSMRGRQRT